MNRFASIDVDEYVPEPEPVKPAPMSGATGSVINITVRDTASGKIADTRSVVEKMLEAQRQVNEKMVEDWANKERLLWWMRKNQDKSP